MRTLYTIDELHATSLKTSNFVPTASNNSIVKTLERAQNHERNFGVLMVVVLERHLLWKLYENVWVLISKRKILICV